MKNGVDKGRKYEKSGKRLRECRKAIGLTQEQLAEKITKLPENRRGDRSFKTIGKMERGDVPISVEYAYLLSKIFGCEPQWLRGLSEIKTIKERDSLSKDNVNGVWQSNAGKRSRQIGIVVGGNIKRYRAKRNMTADRLSETTGIPLEKIVTFENNAEFASLQELDRISKALNVKIASLYGQLPPPADIAQWTVHFSNGDSVGGYISFVVNQMIERMNSDGHEAVLCMLHGLLGNPRYLKNDETILKQEGDNQ